MKQDHSHDENYNEELKRILKNNKKKNDRDTHSIYNNNNDDQFYTSRNNESVGSKKKSINLAEFHVIILQSYITKKPFSIGLNINIM